MTTTQITTAHEAVAERAWNAAAREAGLTHWKYLPADNREAILHGEKFAAGDIIRRKGSNDVYLLGDEGYLLLVQVAGVSPTGSHAINFTNDKFERVVAP